MIGLEIIIYLSLFAFGGMIFYGLLKDEIEW